MYFLIPILDLNVDLDFLVSSCILSITIPIGPFLSYFITFNPTHQEPIAIVNKVCYLRFPRGGPPWSGGKMCEGKAWALIGGNVQGSIDKLSKLKSG